VNMQAVLSVAPRLERLRGFVTSFAELLASRSREDEVLEAGGALLARLVSRDDWLPDAYARPSPDGYRQYLLHCDSRERFSVVSFVWGPGQGTPIHDHRVWGLVGVLRGSERVETFRRRHDGELKSSGAPEYLREGDVDAFSLRTGDIHRVSNAREHEPSISVHVYGGNIGAVERATYDAQGRPKRFISGYANDTLPNLWDRSR